MAFIPKSDRQVAMAKRAAALNAFVFRISGGRVGGKFQGRPLLILHHVGRKSGEERETPLVFIPDGDAYVIAASKAGNPKHPAWYHNIMAAPDTRIDLRGRSVDVHAAELGADERAVWWPRFVEMSSDFAEYEAHIEGRREIPLVRLSPR